MKRSRMGRNEIEDPQVSESVEKAVQGTGFLVVLDRILKGIFGSGQPVDDTDPGGEEEGLIYKRSDPRSDEEYVGQSKSPSRFDARQQEHNRGRGVQHEFEVLDRGTPGQDLDVREEDAIRRHGGLQKEGGRLASKRHQMSEKRYRDAGGKIDDPNR